MIRSMTGYGAATCSSANYKVTVELKSLNSKFLEATLKLPRSYMKYEHKVRSILAKKLVRGKIMTVFNVEVLSADKRTLNINRALAKKYVAELKEMSDFLEVKQEIGWSLLLELPEVIPTELDQADPEEWALFEEALVKASDQLLISRTDEGKALDQDLAQRVHRAIQPILTSQGSPEVAGIFVIVFLIDIRGAPCRLTGINSRKESANVPPQVTGFRIGPLENRVGKSARMTLCHDQDDRNPFGKSLQMLL